MNKRAQAALEFTVIFIIAVILFAGMISIWKKANDAIIKRQVKYNALRKKTVGELPQYENLGKIVTSIPEDIMAPAGDPYLPEIPQTGGEDTPCIKACIAAAELCWDDEEMRNCDEEQNACFLACEQKGEG